VKSDTRYWIFIAAAIFFASVASASTLLKPLSICSGTQNGGMNVAWPEYSRGTDRYLDIGEYPVVKTGYVPAGAGQPDPAYDMNVLRI
jgi:hypothetical protein